MTALFNGLKRGAAYKFILLNGGEFTAVFHEYLPDGSLRISNQIGSKEGYLNPAAVAVAWAVNT